MMPSADLSVIDFAALLDDALAVDDQVLLAGWLRECVPGFVARDHVRSRQRFGSRRNSRPAEINSTR
jgi:hypothetical protein